MRSKIKTILSLIVVLFVNYLLIDAFKYPEVRRDAKIWDNYFGTNVSDPYRWLEDPDSEETKKFVSDQNKVTDAYLGSNKHRSEIQNSFKSLLDYHNYGVPFKAGSKYYMTANTEAQDQDIIYSINSIESNETKVFLDPNQLSTDGTISVGYTIFSKDGRYCAYRTNRGGSDWTFVRIRDALTLEDFPETISNIKFSPVAWTSDNLGFFYSQYDEHNGTYNGSDSGSVKNEKIYYHRLNTSQSEDIRITSSIPGHPHRYMLQMEVDHNGQYFHILPQEDMNNVWSFAKLNLPITKAFSFTPIVDQLSDKFTYIVSDNQSAFALTNRNASNFRIIKIDLSDPRESNWVDVVPEDKNKVIKTAVAFNKDYIAVVMMKDAIDSIEIHQLSMGKLVTELELPVGSVGDIQGNVEDTRFFFKFRSFTTPGIVYEYDFHNGIQTIRVLKESKVSHLDRNQFVTTQTFYQSKDATVKVPLFIMHRKGLTLDGSNPTLLYSYGGFGLLTQPDYDPLGIFFINNLNGVYAMADIRGGGEYGEDWHLSGARLKRQNSFDDFTTAAEYLISNNYTRRDRLVIHGESNGGLLMGVSSNQRPDLFGCTIAGVGVMDMLRYPLFTVGFAWTSEYGNPQTNETEFEYIYRYSPLHNINQNSSQYPAILLLTADHDDRVVPAHSYKFAAQVQHLLGSKLVDTPLMIRIDANSGHQNEGKPVSKQILENTDIVSFVLNSLGIDYVPNGNQ